MARPHAAAMVEDAVNTRLGEVLRSRGWTNRVITHVGYGSSDFVRVFARVVHGRPPGEDEGDRVVTAPPQRADATGALTRPRYDRGWRVFITAPAAGVPVQVTIGERVVFTRTDRGGYIDLLVHDHDLEPGWQQVVVEARGGEPVPADVVIVGADVTFGIVSDIDDTVITTMLPRPMLAAWNTFVLRGKTRRPVAGMAPLYRQILAENPGAPIVYVSTGAWNTSPTLNRFLAESGYPLGPLLLTDWGPTNSGWFRSGQQHKRSCLHRLARDFPKIEWLLIGDDGQHDPALYAEFAEERPDRVRAIAIRQLSAAEQVLSHPMGKLDSLATQYATRSRPTFRAPDGFGLLRALRSAGVVSSGEFDADAAGPKAAERA